MGNYKQLTDKERCQIESFLHAGYKQSEIAKTLGRSKSTIHTEFNRLQAIKLVTMQMMLSMIPTQRN